MVDVETITSSLLRSGYFDAVPILRSQRITTDIDSIADRFSEFSGEEGWKIRAPHVASFISQFPPRLRVEVIHLLLDTRRFLFLNRTETIDLVIQALQRLKLTRPLRLVPLTPSSGQYIRNHIRSSINPTNVSTHAGLADALNSLKKDGGSIVLVDDNIASGTQASRQLDIFMEGAVEKPQGNYSIERLDGVAKDIFRSQDIGAAFSVGHSDGRDKLIETARRHELKLSPENVLYGRRLEEVSGKATVSEGLRSFLCEVGESVLRRRFAREGQENPIETARAFALGYGGLEGLVVTAFSVPTSTYPAFWCPGFREATVVQGESPTQIPWLPLFMRTNMLQHLVLG
jgi:hypothetical protein